jgi:transcriptional regulator with XRE-family HTH domain
MAIRLRIRELREDLDLTQRYISRYILFCDQSEYSKFERGVRAIPLVMAIRLAVFYDVSLDYLVGLSDDPTPYGRIKDPIPNSRHVTPYLRKYKKPKL